VLGFNRLWYRELEFNRTMNSPRITFGDKVRVRATRRTEQEGIAGKTGIVHSFTTPSQTGVEVVGDCTDDYAIAVTIEGSVSAVWLPENVLELVDRQPGTTVQVGSCRLIRDEQGQWHDVKPT
jgi:hypothetical protein